MEHNNQPGLNFDIFFSEEKDTWRMVTAFCNTGGCYVESIAFASEEEAKIEATLRTNQGKKMQTVSICTECQMGSDLDEDDLICGDCGEERQPVWDTAPGLARYCPNCD